jgi:hypothetical protein
MFAVSSAVTKWSRCNLLRMPQRLDDWRVVADLEESTFMPIWLGPYNCEYLFSSFFRMQDSCSAETPRMNPVRTTATHSCNAKKSRMSPKQSRSSEVTRTPKAKYTHVQSTASVPCCYTCNCATLLHRHRIILSRFISATPVLRFMLLSVEMTCAKSNRKL